VYYCFTMAAAVAAWYIGSGFLLHRRDYLWAMLGTPLAIGGATALTYRSAFQHWLERILPPLYAEKMARVAVVAALAIVIVGSFVGMNRAEPLINATLDAVLGVSPERANAAPPPRSSIDFSG